MLYRSSMLQEQIDHLIKYQEQAEQLRLEAKREMKQLLQEAVEPIATKVD